MGDGSLGQIQGAPSFPFLDVPLLSGHHSGDQRTPRVLQNHPLSVVALPSTGATEPLGTCYVPRSPRGVPTSGEFGKHHRQDLPSWMLKCFLVLCCETCSQQIVLIGFDPAFPKCALLWNNPAIHPWGRRTDKLRSTEFMVWKSANPCASRSSSESGKRCVVKQHFASVRAHTCGPGAWKITDSVRPGLHGA